MANVRVQLLQTNNNVAGALYQRPNAFASGYACFNMSRNVYSSSAAARDKTSSSPDSNAMYTIKANTAAKIQSINSTGGVITAQIQCGSKTGWVYIGTVVNKNPNGPSPSFAWNGGQYVKLAVSSVSYVKTKLKLKDSDIATKNALFNNLNKGDEINPDCLVAGSGNEDNAADGEDDSSNSSSSAASTTANANSADTGDIQVTYEYAIKVNPPYAYNILDHLGGVTETEQSKKYLQQVESTGVDIKSLRNIFGMPYQFLPTTDCRVSDNFSDNLATAGYEFAEKIISRMPLLYITPGNTSFMGGSKENARTALISQVQSIAGDKAQSGEDALTQTSLETMLEEYNGKLYTIMPAYAEYFRYVNPLCRAGAIFLDIAGSSLEDSEPKYGNELISGKTTFENMNWGTNEGLAYELWEEEETTDEEDTEDEEKEDSKTEDDKKDETDEEDTEPKKAKFEEDYSEYFKNSDEDAVSKFQQAVYYGNSIAFYINSDASFQDSFTNETSESSLSSTINALSDKAREIQFLLGTASTQVGEAFDKVDGTLSDIKSQINSIVEKISGGNTIFTTIANSVKTIVSGGRMLFPQIWSNSNFSKSYSISIKLTTPSTDRISWWLNIYVPLCHLMALVLPRSEYINSYTAPFIIKAFYKGMFNIDMGIITEMTFNKGKEGSWTKDGLPTVVDVSFTIQDLYSAMGMTSTEKMFKGLTLQNVAEMDYVANLCGININEPDVFRMVNLWCAFNITNKVYDFIPNLSMNVTQALSNSVMKAYNNFWMN